MDNLNDHKLTILPILKKIPIFQDFKEEDHEKLIKNIKMEYFPPNYVIFSEGDQGDLLYTIKSGQVEVLKQKDGQQKQIAHLESGDFFGEMALFSREPRNATITTATECEIFTLSFQDFLNVIKANPAIASRVSKKFLKRVSQNTQQELKD